MTKHRWSSPGVRRVAQALLLGVAVSVGVTALSRVGVLSGWETRAVDAFLFLRDRVPAPEIVLILIDEESFAALGERQPLSRRYLADLVDQDQDDLGRGHSIAEEKEGVHRPRFPPREHADAREGRHSHANGDAKQKRLRHAPDSRRRPAALRHSP